MSNRAKTLFAAVMIMMSFFGCKEKVKEWQFEKIIETDGIKPLGIVVHDGHMWLTDVDHNRLVKTDMNGKPVSSIDDLGRPMHIAMHDGKIYIPEFLNDKITILEGSNRYTMPVDIPLDAPAGIDVKNGTKAIVDFYSHRLVLLKNGKPFIIGKKGHADGEFNYPTDVALFDDKIFVADAYNNRVQVFDYDGRVTQVIGWQEDIKVATGVAVGPDRVYITDFHGDRVLIYDFYGRLQKIFTGNLDKPTDIFLTADRMYVANYGGGFITVFHLQ